MLWATPLNFLKGRRLEKGTIIVEYPTPASARLCPKGMQKPTGSLPSMRTLISKCSQRQCYTSFRVATLAIFASLSMIDRPQRSNTLTLHSLTKKTQQMFEQLFQQSDVYWFYQSQQSFWPQWWGGVVVKISLTKNVHGINYNVTRICNGWGTLFVAIVCRTSCRLTAG